MRKGNAILIKINRTFRENMSSLALYEATRGVWRIGEPRKYVEYAIAVAGGKIREIYRVERWDKAGTHKYETRNQDEVTVEGRWEFSGQIADNAVRDKCVGHDTGKLGQSSIHYFELDELIDLLSQGRVLTMEKDKFEGELNRVGIKQKHVDEAFAWIRKQNKQGDHNIFYYGDIRPGDKTRPGEKTWAALDEEENRYFMKEAAELVYFFACKDKDGWAGKPPFDEEQESNEFANPMLRRHCERIFKILKIKIEGYSEDEEEVAPPVGAGGSYSSQMSVLRQIGQIIFYGPPGTGKTRRAKLAVAELFGFTGSDDDVLQKLQKQPSKDRCWNIVQFHPSYNYEDFVRGIKVETVGSDDNSHVAYKTVNRIFGEMCDIATANPEKDYALIIDEINRANVSAVLGELIYALEYRGEPVNTPYKVNGKEDLIVPKNLYIIGTMNSADRTIGQIDYAVRRRFAFVPCPPDRSVIKEEAREFFDKVDAIFTEHISQDYDKDDVRIGHSYFLASSMELANKMIYQVVPILREYVKDGVLKKDAAFEIDKIENLVRKGEH